MKLAQTIRFAVLGAAALGAAATAALAPVEAFATELKLAHFTSPRHPMDRFFMRPWSEELARMSNGELTVRIFPAGELGKGPQQQFKRAVDGAADIAGTDSCACCGAEAPRGADPTSGECVDAGSGADLNGDGRVNIDDLLRLLAAFGSSADGDTDGDGQTNVVDLLALLADFGQ